VVYQDFTRFPLTARENIALDLLGEPVDPDVLARVTRKAGAADLFTGLNDGWDTVLSAQYEGGQDLSGARLFARFAEMSRAGRESGGVTVLISHRFSTVRMAEMIVVLDEGRVAEMGDHEELLRSGGTYAQLFTLQARAYLDPS
jgi:ATP-binding cassette subfamily B protein